MVTLKFLKLQGRLFMSIHPLAKGMISYAVLWPTGSLIQQTLEGKNLKTYDWMRCLRYSIFGSLYVAPTLFLWIRFSSVVWPKMNLRVGVIKALTEQVTYGPFATGSFYMGMSLLEFKTFDEGLQEVREKFWPTYKVGVCVWPFVQTINFAMVPEGNRVVFVSICSLLWTTYLAFMKKHKLSSEGIYESEDEVVEMKKEAAVL